MYVHAYLLNDCAKLHKSYLCSFLQRESLINYPQLSYQLNSKQKVPFLEFHAEL